MPWNLYFTSAWNLWASSMAACIAADSTFHDAFVFVYNIYTSTHVSCILQQFHQVIKYLKDQSKHWFRSNQISVKGIWSEIHCSLVGVKISPDVVSAGVTGHAWWFQGKSSHRGDDNFQTPKKLLKRDWKSVYIRCASLIYTIWL